MKRILLFLSLFALFAPLTAQNSCSHSEQRENLYKTHPELHPEQNSRHEFLEDFTRQYRENSANRSMETMVIPLVFHVVHDNGEENISDAQIMESILQLNEDYAAINPGLVDVHPNFTDLVADVGMEFRLAELDPNGEPTTGINRIQSELTYNGSQIALKEMIQWDPTMYLNIWVVNSSDGGNGSAFAYYPADVEGSGSIYDGIVSSYWAVGRTETAVWTHYKILTHEVGHWANLKHTWGDQSNNQALAGCDYDDAVDDTPNTIGTTGCDLETTSCGSQDNVQNYMDYSNCSNMFTEGQKTRMLAALNSDVGSRNNLWSPSNHSLVFIQEDFLPRIVYNDQSFKESYANDGSIESSIGIELIDLAFSSTGILIEGVDFTTNNLPIGTSISISVSDASHAQINMSGTVMNHLEADALDNIEIHFTANPFAAVTYEEIYNPSKTNIGLTFMDPYEIVFVDIVDDVHNFFEGQQWKWFSMGSGGADFGLFHYDLINIKLETYGNGAVCNSGTTNISPLASGVEVGPESDITNPGSWYPEQLDLSNPTYTDWNGQTAYAGVEFQKNGNNHYGWVRLKVSADGKHYYALDMAYNETPEASILTGQVQEPVLAYSQTVFNESAANDGSIESQRVIDVFGATWSDFVSLTEGDGFTLSNVPTGLSAQFEKLSETSATISLNGIATDHSNSSDHNYMSLSIDESILDATSPVQSLTEIFSIDFNDHYEIDYTNISESEIIQISNPGTEWKWFSLDVGDAEYGLWHVNEVFRFETYAKSGVCNSGTTDLDVLQAGEVIGSDSYWDYFTELETQLVITSPDYTEWNGQTAYAGIKFTIADRFHYGWMQFEVSEAGDSVTLLDYAYNTNPGEEIAAGQIFATYGCTDSTALNYNPIAIDDDGTCEYPLDCGEDVYMSLSTYDSYGDGWNNNYLTILNSSGLELESFTMNSGSEASYEFCLAPDCYQYSVGGGSWTSEISWEVYMDYEILFEGVGDGFGLISVGGDCSAFIGCTDELAFNYNPDAIEEDGSCTYPVMGCTSAEALNYDSEAEEDDGSCYYDYDVLGCNDPFALNFNSSATYNDGTCEYSGLSLIDVPTVLCLGEPVLITWTGANPAVTVSISLSNVTENTTVSTIATIVNSGEFLWEVQGITEGSTDTYRFYIQEVPWPPTSYSYGNHFTILDDCNNIVYGCTDSFALNYDVDATIDDGSCYVDCEGLTAVTIEVGGGSWASEVSWFVGGFAGGEGVLEACLEDGCHIFNMVDSYGDGWNGNLATITTSNGDVIFTGTLESGSEGSLGFGLNTEEDCGEVVAPILGCTDEAASNYNSDATEDDGSCQYPIDCDGLTTVMIEVGGGSYANEVSWDIAGYTGGVETVEACLEDGCHTFNMADSYGDGWNGNLATITTSNGDVIFTGTLESGSEGSLSFGLNTSEDCGEVVETIDCGTQNVLSIHMQDSYGDGWNDAQLTFYDNSNTESAVLTLENGSDAAMQFCLADGCYTYVVSSGAYPEEITWQINFEDTEVLTGIAPDEGSFALNSSCGTPSLASQTIAFNEGWSMISTYIIPENPDFAVFVAPVVESMIIAKDYSGAAYLPEWEFNGIGSLLQGQGYQVKMSSSEVLVVEGDLIQPEDNPIALNEGWNMIGYLRTEPADAMVVMANVWANGENLVIAKDYQGNAYLPAWGFNGIGDMHPGQGYQLKVNNDDVLNYLSNDDSYRLAEMEIVENNVAHFSKVAPTDNNMTVVIEDAAWDVLPTEGSELAAFDKAGNIIGSAIYSSPVTVVTLWGNDATTPSKDGLEVSEVASFKVWTSGTVRDFTVTEWSEGSSSYHVDAINVASSIETDNTIANLNSTDRVLVKVINVLGQDVNLDDELFKGTILFNIYDDGSVEKVVK